MKNLYIIFAILLLTSCGANSNEENIVNNNTSPIEEITDIDQESIDSKLEEVDTTTQAS